MAFWFELQLDEETSLSTSPYAEKVSFCHEYSRRVFPDITVQKLKAATISSVHW